MLHAIHRRLSAPSNFGHAGTTTDRQLRTALGQVLPTVALLARRCVSKLRSPRAITWSSSRTPAGVAPCDTTHYITMKYGLMLLDSTCDSTIIRSVLRVNITRSSAMRNINNKGAQPAARAGGKCWHRCGAASAGTEAPTSGCTWV